MDNKGKKCEHEKLLIHYHFGTTVRIGFRCATCGMIINKLDNRKSFMIVPNIYLSNAPEVTGIWKN